MKKLHISFILLFGFLAFAPQVTLATRITLSPEQEQEIRKQVQKSLNCLNEKKAKLPAKYDGPNLKLMGIPRYHDVANISTGTGMKYYIDSVAIVEINKKNNDIRGDRYISRKKYTTQGGILDGGCAEFIHIPNLDGSIGIRAYDVTNVPPNSYLKYIPETKEMQVITPADKDYKKFMDEYEKSEKLAEEERLKEEKLLKEKQEQKNKVLKTDKNSKQELYIKVH